MADIVGIFIIRSVNAWALAQGYKRPPKGIRRVSTLAQYTTS